jgi:hypothetical protein
MIIAHHIILTGYGHWLPNDPRGSLSREFRNPKLRELGEIHFGRKRVQPSLKELKAFYAEAADLLQYETVWFNNACISAIGAACAQLIGSQGFTCYAGAVLRNHAHLLIRRHKVSAQHMIDMFSVSSRDALHRADLVRSDHPV